MDERAVDAVSKRPVGKAFDVYHGTDGQRVLVCITLARDKIVFARVDATSSTWLAEPQ